MFAEHEIRKGTASDQTSSFEPLCVKIGRVFWYVEPYTRKTVVKYKMKYERKVTRLHILLACEALHTCQTNFNFRNFNDLIPTLKIAQYSYQSVNMVWLGGGVEIAYSHKEKSSLAMCFDLPRLHTIEQTYCIQVEGLCYCIQTNA